jgi:hypothetical protein
VPIGKDICDAAPRGGRLKFDGVKGRDGRFGGVTGITRRGLVPWAGVVRDCGSTACAHALPPRSTAPAHQPILSRSPVMCAV